MAETLMTAGEEWYTFDTISKMFGISRKALQRATEELQCQKTGNTYRVAASTVKELIKRHNMDADTYSKMITSIVSLGLKMGKYSKYFFALNWFCPPYEFPWLSPEFSESFEDELKNYPPGTEYDCDTVESGHLNP
jgi:hypothetical protein